MCQLEFFEYIVLSLSFVVFVVLLAWPSGVSASVWVLGLVLYRQMIYESGMCRYCVSKCIPKAVSHTVYTNKTSTNPYNHHELSWCGKSSTIQTSCLKISCQIQPK